MSVTCIVVAAGKGKRLGRGTDKAFIKIYGKPVIYYTLKALMRSPFIERIILVVSSKNVPAAKRIVKKYAFKKVTGIVAGGRERQDSVKAGLASVSDSEIVLVHDGARPLIDKKGIENTMKAALHYGASVLCTPAKHTLKLSRNGDFVSNTPDRRYFYEARTPQCFKAGILKKAFKNAGRIKLTDDSSFVERLGKKVKIVRGSYENIKITTTEDLKLARILLKKRMK